MTLLVADGHVFGVANVQCRVVWGERYRAEYIVTQAWPLAERPRVVPGDIMGARRALIRLAANTFVGSLLRATADSDVHMCVVARECSALVIVGQPCVVHVMNLSSRRSIVHGCPFPLPSRRMLAAAREPPCGFGGKRRARAIGVEVQAVRQRVLYTSVAHHIRNSKRLLECIADVLCALANDVDEAQSGDIDNTQSGGTLIFNRCVVPSSTALYEPSRS